MHRSRRSCFLLRRTLVVASSCVCLAGPAQAQGDTLRYELGLARAVDGARVLDVRLTLRGDSSGKTALQLPSQWGDQQALYGAVVELAALGPGLRLERPRRADSLYVRRVRHEPGAELALRYRLRQEWTGALERPNYWRLRLGDDLVVLTGHNALVVPARADSVPCVVTISWRELPAGWRAESSFGPGPEWRASTTYGELRDILLVAGVLRVQEHGTGAHRMRVAVHGEWPFPDDALAAVVDTLLAAERTFWRDSADARYLVALAPVAGTVGGVALANAMVAVARPITGLERIAPVVAHEIFHRWSGHRMRASTDGRHKWLTEGVTDYYADRFARDVGTLPAAAYLDRVNQVLLSYYTSPLRNAPESLVERRYWRDPWLMQLAYQRGYVLALRLDALLREGTDDSVSLDDVLRRVHDGALAAGGALTDSLVVDAAPAALRPRMWALLASALTAGETLPITGRELGGCHGYRVVTAAVADAGFDAVATAAEGRLRGVRPASTAHTAGLRDDMPVRGWGWRAAGADQQAEVVVETASGPQRIAFVPRERRMVRVPQYVAKGRCRP